MACLPPTTRRFLAKLASHPENHERVMAHLFELRSLLVHGASGKRVHGQAGTDWRRIRQIADTLREEARLFHVREAVALFQQVREMAESALDGLAQTQAPFQELAA